MIKAGSAALRCSGGPAGATFDEEGKPVRHSGGGDSGRGRAGRWLGGQGRVGGRDVRLWGESSWCCSSRGPSGKTGNTYSQMSIVVVQSWMRCIWSMCLVAKSGVLVRSRSVACKVSAQVSVPNPSVVLDAFVESRCLWIFRFGFTAAANGSQISSTARPSAFCGRPGRFRSLLMLASIVASVLGTLRSGHGGITATCLQLRWASVSKAPRQPRARPLWHPGLF